jgi:hypothetical protein
MFSPRLLLFVSSLNKICQPQQSCFRGYRDFVRFRYLIIKIQCFVRSHQARCVLKQLKKDDKEKMVQRNRREMEIQRLRKELWKGEKMKCRTYQPSGSFEAKPLQRPILHGSPPRDGISPNPQTLNSPHSIDMV